MTLSTSWPRAVSMITGRAGRLALSCLQTSSPLILGIITSSTTRSGASLSARPRPSAPSPAVITSYPSYSKLSRRPATMLGSSSTIRILVIALDPPSFHEQLLTTVVAAGLPRHKANHGGVKPPLRRRLISACFRTQRQSDDTLTALAGRALYRDLSAV